jgi:hypothetical protein
MAGITNAARFARIESALARIEAALIVGSPAQASASTSATPAAEAVDKPRVAKVTCSHCAKHFAPTPAGSPTGSGFHAGWVNSPTAIAERGNVATFTPVAD